uniref:Uncharacterized protein n=1 Tax=Oryza punctata TaxID=4537 RepID=A0A0E0MPS8_ORYPU
MSRRRRNDGGEADGRASKRARRPAQTTTKHLYLVLDDGDEATYTIHNLDVDDDDGVIHAPDADRPSTRFVAAPAAGGGQMHFLAMAGNIVAVNGQGGPTVVYDTAAAALTFESPLPGRLSSSGALAVVVEDGGGEARRELYALTSLGEHMPASFEALSWARDPYASPSSLLFSSSSSPGRHYYWSWKNVADTPPPFGEEEAVTAYAVHPDGRTIFVSTTTGGDGDRSGRTYSFDTGRRKWRRHGEWVLPFRGQGYFDGELDAWVGLHREVHGGVSACQVASRGGARPPEYIETLDYDIVAASSSSKNQRQRATLTYMGDGMFCAVETSELVGTPSSPSKGGGGVEVHVTVFGLKYNRRGELQARVRRAGGAFPLPKQHVSSRRRDDDDDDGGGEAYRRHRHEKRLRPPAQQKHLYLVLDDWDRGYSIHKLDVDVDDPGVIHGGLDHDHDAGGVPAVRFAAPGSSCGMQFFPMRGGSIVMVSDDAALTLVYDTGAAALTIGSPIPGLLAGGLAIAMPGGERLYALTSLGERFPDAFEVLTPAGGCCGWSWTNAPAPPPPPFEEAVTAYAVHPDGHTVFVSTSGDGDGGTYTLDTKHGEWRRLGDWLLPFHGQGFFDAELDAWVGLLRHGDTICACQVPSRGGGGGGSSRPPEWDTLDDDTVKSRRRRRRRRRRPGCRRATLTYMGDSKFCVVDSVECDGDDDDNDGDGVVEPPECEVHVAVFGLKYNRRGELKATARRATGSFRVPKHFSWFSPMAFWM